LITLTCIIGFRWWDSRTRLDITFWVDRTDSEEIFLVFRVINNSKTRLYISRGYLEYGDDQNLRLGLSGGAGAFSVGTYQGRERYQLPPKLPLRFDTAMVPLAKRLFDDRCEDPIRMTFVTLDGSGKRHEKSLLLRGLEQWAEERSGPGPVELLPCYQRWLRKVRRWI
jgi:hypothetical protein